MRQQDRHRLSPGDIVAIETARGTRHVQITHLHPPYPDVLRAIAPNGCSQPEDIAKGRTSFTAMVELSRAFDEQSLSLRIVGHATIPQGDRQFPKFRVPIRNKAGEILYWWTWDGEGLSVATDTDTAGLPTREVVPVEALSLRLAEIE